jgi:hypothetical protein
MSITKLELEHQIVVQNSAHDESRRLRVVHGRQEVNVPAAERAVRDLLLALAAIPPRRIWRTLPAGWPSRSPRCSRRASST